MLSALEACLTFVALGLGVVAAIVSSPGTSEPIAQKLGWILMAGTAFEAGQSAGAIGEDPETFLEPIRGEPTITVSEPERR
jgi:hypothetical protein